MKNYIRSLPISNSGTAKPSKITTSKATTPLSSPPSLFSFELSALQRLKSPPSRQYISLSPKANVEALNNMLEDLNELGTKEIRKFIPYTRRDLKSRVSDLRSLTRLDTEEYLRIKMERWKNRKFIKVDEREIRQIIKRDSRAVRNFF